MGDGDWLLLSTVKLRWILVDMVLQSNALEKFPGSRFGTRTRPPAYANRCEHHIFQNGLMRKQIEVLKNNPACPALTGQSLHGRSEPTPQYAHPISFDNRPTSAADSQSR